MKKNDIIELSIDSITNLGFGAGRYCGQVVFCSGAVTGDVVKAKIIKVSKSYAVGRVENFIKRSSIRTSDRCTIESCHSCAYKEIEYSYEKKLKGEEVKHAFLKAGLPEVKIAEVVGSPSLTSYRNKAQYPISKNKDGSYAIGFFAPKSHRVTEARNCPLAPEVFGRIIDALEEIFKENSATVYEEESGEGLLRHIYLRRGEVSGEVILTLVINADTLPFADSLVSKITKKFPEVVGILTNTNKENTNVILGEKFTLLYGRDYIYDTLAGVELKITPQSFYQVNHAAATLLYNKARELCAPTKGDVLLDLFCGAGSIGLSMADSVGELVGIEIVDSAVLCARENAKRAGFENAYFFTGDASDVEKLLENAERELGRKIEPTIIVLDPPRAGCSEEVINYTASLAPQRIVYISCNPTTLARDAALFKKLGYECGEVTPFDLFAMTGHVESLVCLTRQTN